MPQLLWKIVCQLLFKLDQGRSGRGSGTGGGSSSYKLPVPGRCCTRPRSGPRRCPWSCLTPPACLSAPSPAAPPGVLLVFGLSRHPQPQPQP